MCIIYNNLAGQLPVWKEGPAKLSPLNLTEVNSAQPGPDCLPKQVSNFSLDPTDIDIGIYPQPEPNSHPFLREIRPLASSGVYSPPPSQPLVGLPNHPPLSPIAHIPNSPGVPQTPDSVFTTEEININKGKPINKNLQRSNVKDWLTNLSPEQEWDHFSPLPTFQNQQEFWNSRGLLPILSTGEFH